MLNKLKTYLPKGEFSRNVLTLMTGTSIAQAIPIAVSPILTRIYSPEDFGVLALFLSITSILSVIVTGRYEFAITLPKKQNDAIQLLWLSIILSFIFSFFTFLIVFFFKTEIIKLLGNKNINNWLYFVPITILLSGFYQTFNYWFNRNKNYKALAKSRVIQTSTTSTINLGAGFANNGGVGGLIIGNILGRVLTNVYFIYLFITNKTDEHKYNKVKMLALAKRYKNFPKYDILASFFNISSNQSTHIFFNVFFGAVTSGYFYLTQRIFTLPISLIAGSIQEVFKMEIISIHLRNGDTRSFYIKTLKKLILLAIIPTILIYFYAVDTFVFIFGDKWKSAGEFVKLMTPVFFLRFVSFPLSYMVYVVEKQIYNIIGQFILLLGILTSFYIGKNFDAKTTVLFITITYSLFYFTYICLSYSLTDKGTKIHD
jgi:O-antigen/teichoic acid export membrane protein